MHSYTPRQAVKDGAGADHRTRIREVEGAISRVREALVTPTVENLDRCRGWLEEAVNALGQLQTALGASDPAEQGRVVRNLRGLSAEIARLRALLDSAAAFHNGWMRLARSIMAGYQADGSPANPETIRRFCLEV